MIIIEVLDLIRQTKHKVEITDRLEIGFGDHVFLKSKREKIVGKVASLPRTVSGVKIDENYTFEALMKPHEIERFKAQQTGELERLQKAMGIAQKLKLQMHFFASYIGWEGKVVSFLFTSSAPVDFRELLKQLPKEVEGRIHLQRVDFRERAQIVGGPGCCGRFECCGLNLTRSKVPMDAVRDQGIMMRGNDKIYDVSGRLKKCLLYELDQYRANRAYLPHIKQAVTLQGRKARVIALDILNKRAKILFDESEVSEFCDVKDLEFQGKKDIPEDVLEFVMPEIDPEGVGI